MLDQTENTDGAKVEGNPEQNKPDNNQPLQPVNPAQASLKPFPEPKVLEAIVDPAEKPKEGATPFSFTNPKALHADMAQPAKGDIPAEKKGSLSELDAQIARDEKRGDDMTYDDYKDSAEMFIDMYSGALTFIARLISKDTSDAAYEFPKAKEDKLKGQLIKVLRKRRAAMPIELLFAGTLIPATAQIIVKATDKRKEWMKKNQDFSKQRDMPMAEKTETVKGGPNKGQTKRRGPGNPR